MKQETFTGEEASSRSFNNYGLVSEFASTAKDPFYSSHQQTSTLNTNHYYSLPTTNNNTNNNQNSNHQDPANNPTFLTPMYHQLTNDPFPPMNSVMNTQQASATKVAAGNGYINAKGGVVSDKQQLQSHTTAQQQQQPIRGNQDRDYYMNLQVEFSQPDPPRHTYATLLAYAILHSPEQKMTLDQIYNWLLKRFPYFETCEKDWRNSIRHNLSLNVMFEKVPRHINELGKGSYWACRPENSKKPESQFSSPCVTGTKKQRKLKDGGNGSNPLLKPTSSPQSNSSLSLAYRSATGPSSMPSGHHHQQQHSATNATNTPHHINDRFHRASLPPIINDPASMLATDHHAAAAAAPSFANHNHQNGFYNGFSYHHNDYYQQQTNSHHHHHQPQQTMHHQLMHHQNSVDPYPGYITPTTLATPSHHW